MTHTTLNVGYYDPFKVYEQNLGPLFAKRVKIRSIHWKLNPQDPLSTVSNIHLTYIPDSEASKSPELLNSEYLRFIFVTATSIDEYRSKVRPLIRQWLNNVKSSKPTTSYYIILWEDVSTRSTTDKFLKQSLLTKIRTDFADDSRTTENAYRIKSKYSDRDTENEAWDTLVGGIKLGIADSISAKLKYYKSYASQSSSLSSSASSSAFSANSQLVGQMRCANLYKEIGRTGDAITCYSRVLSALGDVSPQEGFDDARYEEYPTISYASQVAPISDASKLTKYEKKAHVYLEVVQMLMDTADKSSASNGAYLKDAIQLAVSLLSFVESIYCCYKRNEYTVALIEDYFSNDSIQRILEEDPPEQFYEHLADLRLAERDEMIRIGKMKGYKMKGAIAEVDLLSQDDATPTDSFELHNSFVEDTLASEEIFHAGVFKLSEAAIQYYTKSPYKANTVDSLSTELALMLYYNSNDDKASSLEILNQSFQYYRDSGWNAIASELLELYVQNLQELDNGPESAPRLIESYLEMISLGKKYDPTQFRKLLGALQTELTVTDLDLFTLTISKYVDCDDVDSYVMTVEIKSKIDFEGDVELKLESGTESFSFTSENCQIGVDSKIVLHSKELCVGDYTATSFVVNVGKLKIIKTLSEAVSPFQIEQFSSGNVIKSNTILRVMVPPVRLLNKDELLVTVRVGDKPLNNVVLDFVKSDADRLVPDAVFRLEENQGEDDFTKGTPIDFDVSSTDDRYTFTLDSQHTFAPHVRILLYIPYFFPPDVSETKLTLEAGLTFNGGYRKQIVEQLNTMLSIAVSVQDIFKSSKMFSSYTINSVLSDNPVRIQKVDLKLPNDEDSSEIMTWMSPKNVIAYIDQGSTFFYRLGTLNEKMLNLRIDYNDLHSELLQLLTGLYTKNLDSRIIKYSYIVVTSIIGKIAFKLNLYGLKHKVESINYRISDFTSVLRLIDPVDLQLLADSIDDFVKMVDGKTFSVDEKALQRSRQTLRINVPLPVVNLVDTVELQFEKQLQYLVCEPIPMRLRLDTFVLNLGKDEGKKVRFKSEPPKPETLKIRLTFVDFEQNWLICGEKYLYTNLSLDHTSKTAQNVFDTEIILIPLKSGKLELPRVEVINLSDYKVEMEVDYKNSSESLLVVSELNKVVHSF